MRVPLESVSATFDEGTRAKDEPPISIHSDDRLDTLRFNIYGVGCGFCVGVVRHGKARIGIDACGAGELVFRLGVDERNQWLAVALEPVVFCSRRRQQADWLRREETVGENQQTCGSKRVVNQRSRCGSWLACTLRCGERAASSMAARCWRKLASWALPAAT
ncbi:hypothetical protein T492DRAFT_134454 [Pavlovales sp. CCMP2436]|nr:hypothetical protein T492DRAFT_134454 [Pavlovales sp. CCMP2436]